MREGSLSIQDLLRERGQDYGMGASTYNPHREECKGITDESRDATPSFALLDVQGPVIVTYVYQLVDGEVRSTLFHLIHSFAVAELALLNILGPRSSADCLASHLMSALPPS
jgi:hypothetical protein